MPLFVLLLVTSEWLWPSPHFTFYCHCSISVVNKKPVSLKDMNPPRPDQPDSDKLPASSVEPDPASLDPSLKGVSMELLERVKLKCLECVPSVFHVLMKIQGYVQYYAPIMMESSKTNFLANSP